MKKLFTVCISLLSYSLFATPGDSVKINVHQNFHMDRYGNFDKWVFVNPAMPKSQKIWLKYTLGCLSNGQCEWDYTIKLFARQRTGLKDSSLQQAPSFRVNGQVTDSLYYRTDTTYNTVFNGVTKRTDSIARNSLLLVLYANAAQPLIPTDSIRVWPSNFYTYRFDSNGVKIDSFYVKETNKVFKTNTPYYNVFDVINDIEIGRFISPYAKSFPKTFKYDYIFDVTDYASLLKDSVQLRIQYQGYSYGFTATMDLIYIEGTPAREAVQVENIYNGGFPYGKVNNSIENYLTQKSFSVPANTGSVKAKVFISGHGAENNENCSEFCAKNYYLKLNGNTIATQLVWKDDCGKNAIINQPGTWLYDRANWCPGEVVPVYEYALNVNAGSNNTIDLDLEPFTANGDASYNIAVQLIYYKNYNYDVDFAIDEILAPTNNFWHNRTNPICDNARIKIKNYGKTTIQSADISYKVGNGQTNKITWKGKLDAEKSTEVLLPWLNWAAADSLNTFTVTAEKINGTDNDGNTHNNTATSQFAKPLVFPQGFVIETRTNNKPLENSYTIKNNMGVTVFSKTFSTANFLHRDTFYFSAGCYTLRFEDAGKNGLGFWAMPSEGNGSLRIVTLPNPTIKVLRSFNIDFGTFIEFNFTAQFPLNLHEPALAEDNIDVYPNPALNLLNVKSNNKIIKQITIYNMLGDAVLKKHINMFEALLDVSALNGGVYLAEIFDNANKTTYKKFTVVK